MTFADALALVTLAAGLGAGLWEWLFGAEYRRRIRSRDRHVDALLRRVDVLERREVARFRQEAGR